MKYFRWFVAFSKVAWDNFDSLGDGWIWNGFFLGWQCRWELIKQSLATCCHQLAIPTPILINRRVFAPPCCLSCLIRLKKIPDFNAKKQLIDVSFLIEVAPSYSFFNAIVCLTNRCLNLHLRSVHVPYIYDVQGHKAEGVYDIALGVILRAFNIFLTWTTFVRGKFS